MNKLIILAIGIFLIGCSTQEKKQGSAPSMTLIALADKYITASKTDPSLLIKDNTVAALKAWEDIEDSLYFELKKVNFSSLTEKNDQVTYWNLKEKLESNIALRSCKYHLWNVRHMYGWHSQWIWKVNSENVNDSLTRELVLSRWSQFPKIVSTELENLQLGLNQGYSAPKMIINKYHPNYFFVLHRQAFQLRNI